ncbi:MAG: 50S ribosomal protein L22 [Candidatus Kerfeldbacteria bacterium RIFCSPHIGHO2_02_FULL_42_14]|uniref:Large ribosomal subunit protein uL22 n=1 Tax=Candidatus Kerfeldbacteria bacterium RIFCSPHIGHO2_02_FULL_42_14 TaxID=1798540 RepID=A0A1G2AUC7_9BACT|nr:MAG: 50S ribosomal protein L22 [Candidatus Kerfeldbacteria bacterium RIFCSPHIGHO2_02_FULL_42_14]OGY80422.1 MAG: 50S ribosomal protein L22 [Candidatus Kerfeldbacteria bacterium RIFCSPHIGHO2_12_FULL_42_13]OGY83852.1 MAG: 50S ribosomal protein L22 [Candidatus Kerfeldbacteria bacterium RIFCSPLOWO2_02_FULL_42_19]OGY85302.1 MAG: 50S ribosomal protein L22 [Candidatus Kerfeldbacteria bacterium RIFCSPLOWO2_12_FULL_43_9]
MQIQAKLRGIRISPKKLRLVTDLVRRLSVVDAERQLIYLNKKGARPILKLLRAAIANAENNFKLPKETLRIKHITTNGGSTLHRWRARAHGRAAPIQKKTSIVQLILEDNAGNAKVNTQMKAKK